MRVIYIAGTSHSGSTLLDLMLNAHPAIFASGELLKLNRQLKVKDARKGTHAPCSCGAPSLWECRFWSAVDRRTRDTSGKSLVDLDMLDYRDLDGASAPNEVVFKAVSEVSGKGFVVDSSKLPGRLSYLMRLKDLEIYPVHLVREPKGQINSVVRKHGGFLKHIFRYELIHEQIRRALKSVPHGVVHYQDLVRDPKAALQSILQPLGLDFDPRQLDWAGPRSTRSPAITCASKPEANSCSTKAGGGACRRSSSAPSSSARCCRARRCPRLAPCASKDRAAR